MSPPRRFVPGVQRIVVPGEWAPGALKRYTTCPVNHTEKRDGEWYFGDDVQQLGILVKVNGCSIYKVWCPECRSNSGEIPYQVVLRWGRLVMWVIDNAADDRHCQYVGCTSHGAELHHTAPRATFLDAESWPQIYLCRHHHRAWHQAMCGYQWTHEFAWIESQDCQYAGCSLYDTELHHTAPRETFSDAESWPKTYLCPEHHHRWHQTMCGYQWNRKSIPERGWGLARL